MGNPMTQSCLNLSDLEVNVKVTQIQRLISGKATELGDMLLLNTNRNMRKSYMGSQKNI